MAVENEPRLSAEMLAGRESAADAYSLDIVGDPDDPELKAELEKDIDFDDNSASGAETYLYRDGDLWSVTTDESGQKKLIRNSEMLNGDMLAQYQDAMASFSGGASEHLLEVRAGFLDTETEEFYSRQKLELVDGNRVQVSHELFSVAREITPDQPTLEHSAFGYVDNSIGGESAGPDANSWFEPSGNVEDASLQQFTGPSLPGIKAHQPAEPLIGAPVVKPAERQTDRRPDAKLQPKIPLRVGPADPKPAEPKANAKTEFGPLQWLRQPEPEPVPEPASIFPELAPQTEKAPAESSKPEAEAKKPEANTDQKPSQIAEQLRDKAEQPGAPQPDDSPEPTGGHAAEHPAEAAQADTETPTPQAEVVAPAEDVRIGETAPTSASTIEAPAIYSKSTAETTAANLTAVESTPAILVEPAAEATPTVAEIAPLNWPESTIETTVTEPIITETTIDKSATSETVTHETIIIESTVEPATTQESITETSVAKVQPFESVVLQTAEIPSTTELSAAEAAPEQVTLDTQDESQPAITLEYSQPDQITTTEPTTNTVPDSAPELIQEESAYPDSAKLPASEAAEDTSSTEDYMPFQTIQAETIAPPLATPEAVAHEQPAITPVESDLSVKYANEPAPAEVTSAPKTATTQSPAPASTTHADAVIQTSENGLDITMTLEEPAVPPRRQTRTQPAHLTVGARPVQPSAPIARATEISAPAFEAPLAPAEAPALKVVTEPSILPTTVNKPVAATLATPPIKEAESAITDITIARAIQSKPPVRTETARVEPTTYIEPPSEPTPESPTIQPTEPTIELAPEIAKVLEIAEIPAADTITEMAEPHKDVLAPRPERIPYEVETTEAIPAEIPPLVQNNEPKLQTFMAKSQTAPAPLQSWAEDFGMSPSQPPPELPLVAPNNPADYRNPERLTQSTYQEASFAGSQPFAITTDSDDDDPGLVISFEQSERRRATSRSHSTRSTAA